MRCMPWEKLKPLLKEGGRFIVFVTEIDKSLTEPTTSKFYMEEAKIIDLELPNYNITVEYSSTGKSFELFNDEYSEYPNHIPNLLAEGELVVRWGARLII